MRAKQFGLTAIALATAMTMSTASMAAEPARPAEAVHASHASPALAEKRQAVQGVHADALAILAALDRDPTLAKRLADNPGGAQATLAALGATHAEVIAVQPGTDGAARTITITITIDHVTIEIVIKL